MRLGQGLGRRPGTRAREAAGRQGGGLDPDPKSTYLNPDTTPDLTLTLTSSPMPTITLTQTLTLTLTSDQTATLSP